MAPLLHLLLSLVLHGHDLLGEIQLRLKNCKIRRFSRIRQCATTASVVESPSPSARCDRSFRLLSVSPITTGTVVLGLVVEPTSIHLRQRSPTSCAPAATDHYSIIILIFPNLYIFFAC